MPITSNESEQSRVAKLNANKGSRKRVLKGSAGTPSSALASASIAPTTNTAQAVNNSPAKPKQPAPSVDTKTSGDSQNPAVQAANKTASDAARQATKEANDAAERANAAAKELEKKIEAARKAEKAALETVAQTNSSADFKHSVETSRALPEGTPSHTSTSSIQQQKQKIEDLSHALSSNANNGTQPSTNAATQRQLTLHYQEKTSADNARNSSTEVRNVSSNKFTEKEIQEIKNKVAEYQCIADFNPDGTAKTVRGPNPVRAVINSGNEKFKKGAFTLNYKIDLNDKVAVNNLEKEINRQLAEATKGGVDITNITINGKQPPNGQLITMLDQNKNICKITFDPSTLSENTPSSPGSRPGKS